MHQSPQLYQDDMQREHSLQPAAPTVLVAYRYFAPGYKAGGPIRSLINLIHQLGDSLCFKVITGDRDYGDRQPFQGKVFDCWTEHDGTPVMYVSSQGGISRMHHLLNVLDYDIIYLNSFSCPRFTIPILLLRRAGLIPRKPLVLAPRGELSKAALALKPIKKRTYIRLVRTVGLYDNIRWQASSEYERRDIQREMGANSEIMIAPDLTAHGVDTTVALKAPEKSAGALRIVYLSRIVPHKNLTYALDLLRELQGRIEFDIIGPLDDPSYWERCRAEIHPLPGSITVTYRGPIQPESVISTLSQYHLFLLPTHSENFGHVIHEALTAGCLVLISDQTPWRDLEAMGIGWDLPLEDRERFVAALRRCVAMSAEEHRALSRKARNFAFERTMAHELLAQNRALFAFDMVSRPSGGP